MKKGHIIGIAAIALGVAAVAKLVYDIRTIKRLTEDKEDELALQAAIEQVMNESAEGELDEETAKAAE